MNHSLFLIFAGMTPLAAIGAAHVVQAFAPGLFPAIRRRVRRWHL